MPTIETTGRIAVIHMRSHALVGSLELDVSSERARAVLGRPPDIDDPRIVSWGNITPEEAGLVLQCEEDGPLRAELLDDVRRLLFKGDEVQSTLYYCDSYHGE
jgi:hypothetical protein